MLHFDLDLAYFACNAHRRHRRLHVICVRVSDDFAAWLMKSTLGVNTVEAFLLEAAAHAQVLMCTGVHCPVKAKQASAAVCLALWLNANQACLSAG